MNHYIKKFIVLFKAELWQQAPPTLIQAAAFLQISKPWRVEIDGCPNAPSWWPGPGVGWRSPSPGWLLLGDGVPLSCRRCGGGRWVRRCVGVRLGLLSSDEESMEAARQCLGFIGQSDLIPSIIWWLKSHSLPRCSHRIWLLGFLCILEISSGKDSVGLSVFWVCLSPTPKVLGLNPNICILIVSCGIKALIKMTHGSIVLILHWYTIGYIVNICLL